MEALAPLQGVFVSQPQRPDEFIEVPLSKTIEEIITELDEGPEGLRYKVRFDDDHQDVVCYKYKFYCLPNQL